MYLTAQRESRACVTCHHRTYKAIPKGSELLVYYGDNYARELNISVQTFRKAPNARPPGQALAG